MDRRRNMLIGIVVGIVRVGEGDYDEAERLIQQLLAEKETKSEDKSAQ